LPRPIGVRTRIDFELAEETMGERKCKVGFRCVAGVDMKLTLANIFGHKVEQ
jgi:hypothetical protein